MNLYPILLQIADIESPRDMYKRSECLKTGLVMWATCSLRLARTRQILTVFIGLALYDVAAQDCPDLRNGDVSVGLDNVPVGGRVVALCSDRAYPSDLFFTGTCSEVVVNGMPAVDCVAEAVGDSFTLDCDSGAMAVSCSPYCEIDLPSVGVIMYNPSTSVLYDTYVGVSSDGVYIVEDLDELDAWDPTAGPGLSLADEDGLIPADCLQRSRSDEPTPGPSAEPTLLPTAEEPQLDTSPGPTPSESVAPSGNAILPNRPSSTPPSDESDNSSHAVALYGARQVLGGLGGVAFTATASWFLFYAGVG